MSSSMLAGERRWASARRGGMTVLGKVAVPKPINLPSQRLENHGLDPNVEIVPKGSLSWGNRSSSSTSNPWGSSGMSPNGDGASGSPSGRPSSGGSGTRPSTAGSDRMHEPTPSAWGSNSRPSSASGSLTTNQTSLTSLRPNSAETRPGSSQLSRFAEPLPDNSVAWGPPGSVDKFLVASAKNDGFSLISGDFPTLGSEKDNSGKNTEPSQGRPSSSSSRVPPACDRTVTSESDIRDGTMNNTWNRDGTQHFEEGVPPSSEKWQGGYPQQYSNPNVPPQHFDAWHGPPMNAPAGGWYGGPPGGQPYGPPVGPGGYPIEPFPYYRPPMPPPALGNSQPVAGPRGHHPKNGDVYRPQIPEGYMPHHGMPIRPGFYPPGPVPYESYYGPPMGYCNLNERDVPFMGMAAGPPVFNRYPAQNTVEPSNSHARSGGRGSNVTTLVSEQVESGRSEDTRAPYKVLTKRHNEWDAKEEGSSEHSTPGNAPFLEKRGQPRAAFRKNEWGADDRSDEEMHSSSTPLDENSSSRKFENRGRHSLNKEKTVDDSWGKKSETVPSFQEVPRVLPAGSRDSTLLQKIEGLNAKARASDGREDVDAFASSREEQKNRLHFDSAKPNNSVKDTGTAAVYSERPRSGDMIHQSTVGNVASRRAHHGMESRVNQRGKGVFNNPDGDGWQKKPLVAEYSAAIPAANVGPVSTVHDEQRRTPAEAAEKPESSLPVKAVGESLTQLFDTSDDGQAQREKMREMAKQRAIQLQKEEEERIREQKAKALAKLEELDRRSKAADGSTQKLEKAPLPSVAAIQQKQDESQIFAEPPALITSRSESPPSSVVVSSCNNVVLAHKRETSTTYRVGESTAVLVRNSHEETPKNAEQESVVPQSSSSNVHNHAAAADDFKTAPKVNERENFMGYKETQNVQVPGSIIIPFGTIGEANIIHSSSKVVIKDNASAAETVVPGNIIPDNALANLSITPAESLAPQRKKVLKNGKNKNKLEDPLPAMASQVSREPNPVEASTGSGKTKASQSELVHSGSAQLSEQHREESHAKVNNNQWKSQHSRRMPRSGQANKVADRSRGNDGAVWAPVRSLQQAELGDETSLKTVPDTTVTVTAKSDNLGQNNNSLKSKRAEMERYVPKPVAKELAQQQGNILQQSVSSSFSQTTSEPTGGAESSFQRSESSQANIGDDNKQIKQAKAHGGAWRQRGSSVKKHMDQQETLKPTDLNQVKAEPNYTDEWDPNDGWNMPEEPKPASVASFGTKDQGVVKDKGKQRQQHYKGHKSMGHKHHEFDQKNSNDSGEMNKKHLHSAALEDNRGGERAASQWQPKSQAVKTDSLANDLPPMVDKEQRSEVIPHLHSVKNSSVGEASNFRHQEGRRERKVSSYRERPLSPNIGLVISTDEQEQRVSSGFRKHGGSQNNRFGRGQESRGDWSSSRQDNNRQQHHNVPGGNRERESRNLHYEYQPVGSYSNNNSKSNNFEGGPTDGSRNMGPRYKERGRGQGHSRRGGGNTYGRQSSATQADAGYD